MLLFLKVVFNLDGSLCTKNLDCIKVVYEWVWLETQTCTGGYKWSSANFGTQKADRKRKKHVEKIGQFSNTSWHIGLCTRPSLQVTHRGLGKGLKTRLKSSRYEAS